MLPLPRPRGDRVVLRASPCPARDAVHLECELPAEAGSVRLEIFDPSGRCVARRWLHSCAAGRLTLTWDGRAADGSRLGPGSYRARLAGTGVNAIGRVLLLR
jgi:flagellar hook assembly protein FlgD